MEDDSLPGGVQARRMHTADHVEIDTGNTRAARRDQAWSGPAAFPNDQERVWPVLVAVRDKHARVFLAKRQQLPRQRYGSQ